MIRPLAAIVALTALAACSHGASSPSAAPSGSSKIGYVRMDELVRKHPLYAQLAQYNQSIEAFDLRATAPSAVAQGPEIQARERDLQRQLNAAADRTKKLLDEKQKQYQSQEAAAINAALRSAGTGGPGAMQIAGSVNATAQQQTGGAATQAQRDLESYRVTLQKQGDAQIAAAQKALTDRASRTYRSEADRLQAGEAALSLRLANEDSAQRLALRTKLSSLALDDAAREDAQKQLAALDRKEADAVGAQRNRDQQTLTALQTQLRAQVQTDLRKQVDLIHQRTMTQLAQRQAALVKQMQVASTGGAVVQRTVVNGKPQQQVNSNLPPALRSRIEQLHNDYQKRFQNDAQTTIADFNKTREDLSRRYAQLHGVDAGATASAQSQIATLKKKRDDLYSQITAQIGREVRVIAQERGISVVLTDVVAPVGGVDLTSDAMKDIESLHE